MKKYAPEIVIYKNNEPLCTGHSDHPYLEMFNILLFVLSYSPFAPDNSNTFDFKN